MRSELSKLGPSPINVEKLTYYLDKYPNKEDANLLREGFTNGFRLQYTGNTFRSDVKNLKSADLHLNELKDKLLKEVKLGRIIGPFDEPPLDNFKVSPVGLVPKSDGGWRLITHLSYPYGDSVNDGIDDKLCSVSYTSFDKVSKMVFDLGSGALMAKRDIKSAFRLLPIHPDDFHLLGIKVDGKYYVDRMLPMGLSLSCSLFEKFSTFLHWLVSCKSNLESLDHYLDDFIFAGKRQSNDCELLVHIFSSICMEIGVPIAEEKSVGPTTLLVFLGLELDSVIMSIRIPIQKIEELQSLLTGVLGKQKITLKDLQSLVGKLCFFCQAIRASRAFLRRFYDAMIPLKQPFHRLRLSKELKEDFKLWVSFLENFNGITYIPANAWLDSNCLQLFTDSSGTAELGCGCFYNGKWAFFKWPKIWYGTQVLCDITFLEMVPVLLAVKLWGELWKRQKILLHIDNEALVYVINKQSSKSKRLMKLVREFILLSMKLDIVFKAVHISSKSNGIADAISRIQLDRLKMLAPDASEEPEQIPENFHSLILGLKLSDL